MTNDAKLKMLDTSWKLHNQVETSFLNNLSKQGSDKWIEKQRLLLADMALHLLQTSISPGEIKLERLRDNIHAILTTADVFLPNSNLKKATYRLYADN